MQKKRMMKMGVFQAITDLFRKPITATNITPSLSSPWSVYLESDLRGGVVPVFPYTFLLDHDRQDAKLPIPVIAVDFTQMLRSFQLDLGGSNYAKAAQLTLHCIGRTAGESEDMGSYISENLRAITIYDYNNPLTPGPWPVVDTTPATAGVLPASHYPILQIMQIDPFIGQARVNLPSKQKFQGMITGSEIVTFRFITSF